MSPDDKKKVDEWWSRQIEKFPQLLNKYGKTVPLDQSGRLPRNVIAEVQTARQAQAAPRTDIQVPEPVNWREAGRDIASGLANISQMPLNIVPGIDFQQRTEEGMSSLFGVEPRDFDTPEDAGFWRTVSDPLLPTLQGLGTISERFLDPSAAAAWHYGGRLTGTDPYNMVSTREALRDQGIGPLASITGAYEQADIPWYYRIPVEVLTSPEELIPGVGIYAGAASQIARQAGRQTAKRAARATAEGIAKQYPEQAPGAWEKFAGDTGVIPVSEPAREVAEEVPVEPIQLGLLPTEPRQIPLEGPPPEQLVPDMPVSEIGAIQPVARGQIDEIINNVTDTYDVSGKNIIRAGTSTLKTRAWKERAQNNVRDRFDQLIDGSLNNAQTKRASNYIARQTGLESEEILRLANQAASEETFGRRLTPDEQLIEDIAESIETTYAQQTRFSPEIELEMDNLMSLRQEGKHRLPGYKSYYGRLRNQLATTTEMTPAALDKYLDEISQGELPIHGRNMFTGEDINISRQQLFNDDPQSIRELNRYSVQLELPLLDIGSKPKAVEEAIALRKNEGFPIPLIAVRRLVSGGGERELEKILPNVNTELELEKALRELITPDEAAAGYTLRNTNGRTAAGQQLVVRFEGTMNRHMNEMDEKAVQGAGQMQELGFGERVAGVTFGPEKTFLLKELDWGTREAPGPLRFLYRALHGEVKGMPFSENTRALSENIWVTGRGMTDSALAHPAMSPQNLNARQKLFNDLKGFTKWEESMRIDFDPKQGFIAQDYFYRGWRVAEGLSTDTVGVNISRLAQTPSYQKARTTVSYWELEDAGMEPLYRNPWHMALHSRQAGLKYRLQVELAEYLLSPQLNVAFYAPLKSDLLNLKTIHGKSFRVPKIGPAFEGKGHAIMKQKDTSEVLEGAQVEEFLKIQSAQVDDIARPGAIAVPDEVANALESIFHGGAPQWNKVVNIHIPKTNITMAGDITKLIDALVFIPKRIKLFGSVFQVMDFARRIGVGGIHGVVESVWSGLNRGMTPNEAFDAGRVVAESSQSVGSIGKGWVDMWGGYFSAGKTSHYRNLLKSTDTTGPNAVMEGTDITWDGLVRNGLNTRDLTILPGQDVVEMVDDIARSANFPKKMLQHVKELEYSSRRGLFNRAYPAAIMTDVKYNLVPIAKRMYPNATPNEIMALVARQANLKYSTLLRSQSRVTQFFREVLTRTMFSLNENESLLRQVFKVAFGHEKAFWAKYWLSAGLFFTFTANIIHAATTLVTEGEAKALPKDRYVPVRVKDKGWPIGYQSSFLSPDIPIRTRSGERAMIDMLGQLDTAGRMLQPLNFITSRQGATMGALQHLVTGKDFYGRETDKFGHIGRVMQFAFDIGVPIGMGEAGIGAAREAFGEQQLPAVDLMGSSIIAPDTKLGDVLPVSEQSLGMAGMMLEATGENIRAPSSVDLQRKMILNTFPNSNAKRLRELDADAVLKIEEDPDNRILREELKTRSKEGAALDDVFDQQRVERDEVKSSRMQAEQDLVARYELRSREGKSWEPTQFKNDLRKINQEHRVRQDMISQKYGEDPMVAMANLDKENMSQEKLNQMRHDTPLRWAWHQYAMLINEHSEAFKKMDYDAFNAALNKEQEDWGEELINRFDAHRANKSSVDHADRVNAYYQAMDRLDKVGWFDSKKLNALALQMSNRMPKRKDGTGLLEIWEEWLKASSEERRRIERTSPYRDTILMLGRERTRYRNELLSDPQIGKEIDMIVIEWFGRVPMHRDNLFLYESLYGVLPTRMASIN